MRLTLGCETAGLTCCLAGYSVRASHQHFECVFRVPSHAPELGLSLPLAACLPLCLPLCHSLPLSFSSLFIVCCFVYHLLFTCRNFIAAILFVVVKGAQAAAGGHFARRRPLDRRVSTLTHTRTHTRTLEQHTWAGTCTLLLRLLLQQDMRIISVCACACACEL